MLDINSIDILRDNVCSLKETSKDNHDGLDFYMTESMVDVVNFDLVKDDYVKGLSLTETPKSCDAFYIDNIGDMYFVEFKSGRLDKKIFSIRLKIFDSILILMDIVNMNISYARDNLNYILVYNENKNPLLHNKNDGIQISKSRIAIADYFMKKGHEKLIRFNLERFEKLYFKNVFTLTEDEFNSNFANKWENVAQTV